MGHSLRRENILDPRVAAAGPFWHAPRKWRRPVTSRNPRLCTASTGGSKREENGKEGHQGSRGWLASLDWSAGRMEGVVESCRFISISRSRLVRGRRDTPVNRSCLRGERASSSSFNPWPNLCELRTFRRDRAVASRRRRTSPSFPFSSLITFEETVRACTLRASRLEIIQSCVRTILKLRIWGST